MSAFQARLEAARAAAFRMVTMLDGMIAAKLEPSAARTGLDLVDLLDHGATLTARINEAVDLSRSAMAERLAEASAEPDHSHDSGEFPRPPVGAA